MLASFPGLPHFCSLEYMKVEEVRKPKKTGKAGNKASIYEQVVLRERGGTNN